MTLTRWKNYSIVRPLPRGGIADLYVARDPAGTRVLLRFLRREYLRKRRIRRCFISGGKILSKLDHPGIVKLIDRGRDRGRPYMVLAHIDAPTLRDLIGHQDALLRTHPLRLLMNIAAPLSHLHVCGFLHLDLKPENLLVKRDASVTLVDFDLAMPRRRRPVHLRELSGTLAYLSPEALSDRRVDVQSDIYSFGVLAYEILTGQKPFSPDQPRTRPPRNPRQLNDTIPEAIARIVRKCLAPSPEDRYPSTSIILKDMKSLL